MTDDNTPEPKDLPTKSPTAGSEAVAQAEAAGGIFTSTILRLDDGTPIKIPPHPSLRLLDDDVLTELDRLDFDLESYDRHPDQYIPAQKGKDRNGDEIDLPAQTVQGALKYPYRKTGADGVPVMLDPPYDVQQVQIVLGRGVYEKLRAGTVNGERGSLVHVRAIWREQNEALGRRQAADDKSAGSSVDLAPVPEADSERPVEIPSGPPDS